MEPAKVQIRRRVFVAMGLLVVGAGVWRYWVKYASPLPGQRPDASQPFVQVPGKGQPDATRDLQEKADLFDPTPLFIPTDKNYGQGGLPSRVIRQPGQVFGTYDPKFNFGETGSVKYGLENELTPDTLPEIVSRGNEAPLAGFGEIDRKAALLPAREGFIEVKSMKDGRLQISEAMAKLVLPKADFAPAEFVIVVGSAGLVGEPFLKESSGSDDDDVSLREFLGRIYRLGEKLPPGRYAVTIGP